MTSDITVFETDDAGEPARRRSTASSDRAVFADNCGYVYKINPAQNLSGGYMDNAGYGTISTRRRRTAQRAYALFSTTSAGAIGALAA